MFGDKEVLVPARKLLGLPGGTQETASSIEYFHILLDRHEVVCANGAWSETLLTGPDTCREIALLFPELASPSHVVPPARRIVEPRWTGQMIQRHLANGRDLHEPGGRRSGLKLSRSAADHCARAAVQRRQSWR